MSKWDPFKTWLISLTSVFIFILEIYDQFRVLMSLHFTFEAKFVKKQVEHEQMCARADIFRNRLIAYERSKFEWDADVLGQLKYTSIK